MFESEDYVTKLLDGFSGAETPEQLALRRCIEEIFDGKSDIDRVSIAGALITYTRDHVLSALAGVRRTAAYSAKTMMSSQQIATATGLSVPTVSRLVTEHRNYDNDL